MIVDIIARVSYFVDGVSSRQLRYITVLNKSIPIKCLLGVWQSIITVLVICPMGDDDLNLLLKKIDLQ